MHPYRKGLLKIAIDWADEDKVTAKTVKIWVMGWQTAAISYRGSKFWLELMSLGMVELRWDGDDHDMDFDVFKIDDFLDRPIGAEDQPLLNGKTLREICDSGECAWLE